MYMEMAKHVMKLQRRWDREMGALRDRGKKEGGKKAGIEEGKEIVVVIYERRI